MKSDTGYYTFNTMPLSVFEKIQETDNYELIKISKFAKGGEFEVLWNEINDNVTALVGRNNDYIQYLRHKLNRLVYLKMYYIDGRHDMKVMAFVEGEEMKEYESRLQSSTIDETLFTLAKNQGYHIKKTEITVREFFTLIKMHGNSSKKQ